jgi:hypothetical protein
MRLTHFTAIKQRDCNTQTDRHKNTPANSTDRKNKQAFRKAKIVRSHTDCRNYTVKELLVQIRLSEFAALEPDTRRVK